MTKVVRCYKCGRIIDEDSGVPRRRGLECFDCYEKDCKYLQGEYYSRRLRRVPSGTVKWVK